MSAIPLVQEIKSANGILTNRQQTWVSSATNDFTTENPVIYRHKKQEKAIKNKITENEAETFNVRGLPTDLHDNAESSAGLIEKIQDNRKERHEATYEDMIQELAAISLELEPQIGEVCQTVKGYLDSDLKEMEKELSIIADDQSLLTLSKTELINIWKKIEFHAPRRFSWIEELNNAVEDIEKNKALLVREVFKAYKVSLENIAHLMPADVQRLMENEAMEVNTSLLRNKKAVADLIAKLMLVDVNIQRQYYIKWQNRFAAWKSLKIKEAIRAHNECMESESVVNSQVLRRLLDELVMKQKNTNARRLELLKQLRDMKPPISTKTIVYQWNCALTNMTDELDQMNALFIADVKSEHSKILEECTIYINKVKHDLLAENIIDEKVIDEFFEDTFIPLVGERKAAFDYHCEKLEKHINEVSAEQKQNFKALFKYTQGIAHIWDIHEIGLAKEERYLQELLDKNRREHDYQNQVKEAKLDIVMDRMRQDSTGETLNSSLNQSLLMMDEIKKGYLEFHRQQQEICQGYPKMINEELKRYSRCVCDYFNAIPHERIREFTDGMKFRVLHSIKLSNNMVYDIVEIDEAPSTADSDRSTLFSTKTLMTDLDDDVEKEKLPYVESFGIQPLLFDELKQNLRNEFLEHLQTWNADAHNKAENIMMAKIEETNNELDLRLHLHEPRPGRAEKDVHNVRRSELAVHEERVEHHCAGVTEGLQKLKQTFQEMLDQHIKENEKYRKSVEELEASFSAAANTHELKAMQSEVGGKLGQFIEAVRSSVRHFRFHSDEVLNKLRSSNAKFRKSLKIFSEGGNFSPDEVDDFRKRLEKLATRIDNCEGSISGELEGLETKRMEVAKEFAGKLEDRFKQHLFDLTFIEKMKRWLTNIQVKVKAEVANSNSQSQHLSKMITEFNVKLKKIQSYHVDIEQYTAQAAHDTLIPILEAFRDRVTYLNCAVRKDALAIFNTSIDSLNKTNEKNRERVSSRNSKAKKVAKKLSAKAKKNTNVANANPQNPTPTVPDNNNTSEEILVPSAPIAPKPQTGYGLRRNSGVRTTLGGKYDKKYLVFGDSTQSTEPETHFLALQIKILQIGLDGLLSTAELYYRQKGQRSPTRNQVINESFDACADSLIQRLKKYKTQTEAYHNDCIQEFRAQIKEFNGHLKGLPSLLMSALSTKHHNMSKDAQQEVQDTLDHKIEYSSKIKKEHEILLRPTLGHPNNKSELEKLKSVEQERQTGYEKSLDDYERLMKECSDLSTDAFVNALLDLVTLLLSQFDIALTVDEVIIGEPKPKAKTEKELLLGKNSKQEEKINEAEEKVASSPFVWPNLDATSLEHELTLSNNLINQTVSIKITPAHKAVIEARDEEFKEFCEARKESLKNLEKTCLQMRKEHQRWQKNWEISIEKITQLY